MKRRFVPESYDVVRRGIVMQTTDELTNIRMIFQRTTVGERCAGPTSDR